MNKIFFMETFIVGFLIDLSYDVQHKHNLFLSCPKGIVY